MSLDGSVEQVASTGGSLLGLAIDAAGRVYACDNARHAVLVIEPATGDIRSYSSGTCDLPMRTPNFPCFGADGSLYVSDSGIWEHDDGVLFRISPEGVTEVWSRELPHFTNGCCLTPDGGGLYIVESRRPAVSLVPIRPDGSAGDAVTVVELPGTVPDGVAVDAQGALYIACYEPDAVYRLPRGGPLEVAVVDHDAAILAAPTNLAFGGADGRTLAVANLKGRHLSVATVATPGIALHHPDLSSAAGAG